MTFVKRSKPTEPVKLKVKKGDTVQVISGKDKGKKGIILEAMPKENKIIVEGANIRIKHRKDRQTARPDASGANAVISGGRIEEPAPLFVAKVMLVCPACSRPTRVGYAYREGEEKLSRRKYRVCKHADCGKAIDKV
ncbi:MAG: 50S ribosomal protein L24 [Chthonomonadaceae bacterium]|nr:50S ribosomal protein L24 [Chthonomonadaceae bacterium]